MMPHKEVHLGKLHGCERGHGLDTMRCDGHAEMAIGYLICLPPSKWTILLLLNASGI